MATVPLYQITILETFYECSIAEEIAAAKDCSGISFALKRAWCYIEVIGFWVNIFLLILYLLKQ